MDVPKANFRNMPLSRNTNKRLKTSNLLEKEQKKMKFNFIPTLEHIARVNVILLAWNHPTIRTSIINLLNVEHRHITEISTYWRLIEIEVIERIKQFPLPKSVIESVICFAEDVGKPVIGWLLYYENMILKKMPESTSRVTSYLDHLVWTPRGTINLKKTAQCIMNRDEVTVLEKYLVACTFCVEKNIALYAIKDAARNVYKFEKRNQPMLWYWTHYTEGKINELRRKETRCTEYESIYHFLVDLIIYSGTSVKGENDAALKYIWCKLRSREKLRLIKPLLEVCSPECCCFILLRTGKFLEQAILKKQSHNILKLFIQNNLWIDEIISMVQYMFQYFNEESYSEIMKTLQRHLKYYRKKIPNYLFIYDKFVEILREMWRLSPPDFRSEIFDRDDHLGAEIISALAWENSERMIRTIFEGITPSQRKDVMESKHGIKKCFHFINANQRNSFEEFLSLGIAKEDDVSAIKKKLLRERSYEIFSAIKKEKGWSGLIDFFEWFFKSAPMTENDQWCQLNAIFESYCDDYSEKLKYKAQFLIYHLSNNSGTDATISFEKGTGFTKLEKLLNWYSCPLEIHQLRTSESNMYLNYLIHFSIREKDLCLANQILCLFFLKNDLCISTYKRKFFYSMENRTLIFNFITQDTSYKSLENYMNWCLCVDKKINSENSSLHIDIILELLKSNDYILMDNYISWLNLSYEEITNLKAELMKNVAICNFAKTTIENEINEFELTSRLRRLIEWINPSLETIDMFCETYEDECPLHFYHLLRRYETKSYS